MRQWYIIVWSSAHTDIYLQINKYIYFPYFFGFDFRYWFFTSYFIILKVFLRVPIREISIFGAHLFFRSNLPYIQPWHYDMDVKIYLLSTSPAMAETRREERNIKTWISWERKQKALVTNCQRLFVPQIWKKSQHNVWNGLFKLFQVLLFPF